MLAVIKTIPIGKGMAGLAVERAQPVDACNIQTDGSGDVRPGAKATGMEGAIVVPVFDGARVIGALGIANRSERTFSQDEKDALIAAGRALVRAPRAYSISIRSLAPRFGSMRGSCPPRSTELPSNKVRWSTAGGDSQSPSFICPPAENALRGLS